MNKLYELDMHLISTVLILAIMILATQYISQLCILLDSHVRNRVLMERTSTLLGGGVNAEE